jgi:hypothetical protein
MSYKLILTAEAQQEETEAYNYYEDIKEGLGEELLRVLNKYYNKIIKNPFSFSYIDTSKTLRDIKIDKFPYLIVYLVSGNNITVLSVRNTSRRPFI